MTDISPPQETDHQNSGQVSAVAQTEPVASNYNISSMDDSNPQVANSADTSQRVTSDVSTQEPISPTISNTSNSESHHRNHPKVSSSFQQDAEQRLLKAKRDLESMVLKYAKSEQENLQNKIKVDELDKKLKRAIKDNDQLANRIKLLSSDKNQLTDSLSGKVAQLTVLEQKNTYLNNIQSIKLKEYEEKIKLLESSNEELQKQTDDYKSKQTELMDFSERLSMKHMLLQSELEEALKKIPSYKEQHENSLRDRDAAIQQREELSEQIDSLSESLTNEQKLVESLRKALDEAEQKYQATIDEHHNEIKIMRRKHQMATRELVKEIKQLQVRLGKLSESPFKEELQINA